MAIPNTTPTPNELYNGEMKKMSDTELRIVMLVTRATLGWEIDHETGMRKQEDWISGSQLIEKSGRKPRAISYSIGSCIKNGWIEARDKEGNLLDTPQKRSGNKIFYRLGRIFLDKLETPAKSAQVGKDDKTYANNAQQPMQIMQVQKVHTTKETILTKETLTKEENTAKPVLHIQGIGKVLSKFKLINPSYEQLFSNKTQRSALERLVAKYGAEKVGGMITACANISGERYAPTITTPLQLEQKLGDLVAYFKKQKNDVATFNG